MPILKSILSKISYIFLTGFFVSLFFIAFQISATTAKADPLPADNFDDNILSDLWILVADDPTQVWLDETNGRLEARSTANSDCFSAYVPRQWKLSTNQDFAMQIDWHYSSLAKETGLFFGVNVLSQLDDTYIDLNLGVDDDTGFPKTTVEASTNGNIFDDTDGIWRLVTDGIFYVSYNSTNDILYLSINGYWQAEDRDNGDWVFKGILKGVWNRDSVSIDIGCWDENEEGFALNSGDAYFDNFLMTEGTLIEINDKDTIGLYDPTDSRFYLKNNLSGGPADTRFYFGPSNSDWKPIAGDWNGNGQTTVGFLNPFMPTFCLKNSHSGGTSDIRFILNPGIIPYLVWISNAIPIAGDWNGSGQCGVGLYNQDSGTFHLKYTTNSGLSDEEFRFGPLEPELQPISGDWDGDGMDSIGLYAPQTGIFYLKNSLSGGSADERFRFGPSGSNWKPISGDWDDDGIDEIGLFNPITSSFYLKNTHSGGTADIRFYFGPAGSGWIPLSGNWE